MSSETEKLEEEYKALHENATFAKFVKYIYLLREDAISDMQGAKRSKLVQISGELVGYDRILKMANWEYLQARHRDALKHL